MFKVCKLGLEQTLEFTTSEFDVWLFWCLLCHNLGRFFSNLFLNEWFKPPPQNHILFD